MLIRSITKTTNDSFKKLNENVNKLLLEDIEAVKRQYSYIPEEEFYKIIKLDPTYKEGSNSVGKYGKWLLGLYKKDNPLEYDAELIYNVLNVYDIYKNDRKKEVEKDINKIKSIDDLYNAVNNAEDAELSARQQEREKRNSKDIKKIFEDSKWEVWVPQSYAGSCTLGKGTTWCTSYSDDDSYYKQYTSQGPLYVFINKQNPREKYQLHVETESFMDKDDKSVNLDDVLATDDKLRQFVYKNIYGYKIDDNGNFIYENGGKIPKSATSVIVEQGVTTIEEWAFYDCESLKSIIIPDSVTSIGAHSFFNCKSLKSITLPNSITNIGEWAFDYCTSLELDIPDSVTEIGDGVFAHCRSLKSIKIPNSITEIGDSLFEFCRSLQSVNIPDSVTKIGHGAFNGCESLQSINIPDSVTSIDSFAFTGCRSLQSVNIPDSVTKIGMYTFNGCDSLQSVKISNSVTKIGMYTFAYCESLQSIDIPNSVTYIDDYAFEDCEDLTKVILRNPNTKYEKHTFPEYTEIIKKGVNESMKIRKSYLKKDANKIMQLKESSVDDVNTLYENDKNIFVHKYSIPYRICIESDYDYEDNWYQYPPHCDYLDDFISKAVEDFNGADMSQYIPKDIKAISAQMYPTDDFKRLMIEIKTMIRLDDNQLERLRDWITGQMSDGWGEGFEQQELDTYSETEYEPYYEEDEDGNEIEYEDEIEINYYVYGQVWWSDDIRHSWSLDILSENQNDSEINENVMQQSNKKMKIIKNESINIRKAKRLMEKNGYKVIKNNHKLNEAYEYPYFKAYITNLGKYNEGELVGEWVDFPIDEDDFADVLESIGIDGNYYEEWFVTDYDCNLNGFDWQELGEYPSLDDLNEFGELIDDIDSYNLEAINNAYEVTDDLEEAINGIKDGTIQYIPLENKTEENVGYCFIDEYYEGEPTYELALEYFDYKRYGRDIMVNNRGMFTKDGCVLMWR